MMSKEVSESTEDAILPGGPGSPLRTKSMTLAERADALDATVWGADFDWATLQKLAEFLQAFTVKPNQVIFKTHAPSHFLCLIVEGAVQIEKPDSTGALKPIRTIGAGKAFGEIAILDAGRRTAHVTAEEHTVLLVLTRGDFERLSETYPRLALDLTLRLARILAARLRQASGMLVEHL
jgi:CRP-like cAMP-binding protein